MSIVWLIAFVVFLAVEGMTASLTSIWFAGGSLAALMAQVLGGGLKIQLSAFVAKIEIDLELPVGSSF